MKQNEHSDSQRTLLILYRSCPINVRRVTFSSGRIQHRARAYKSVDNRAVRLSRNTTRVSDAVSRLPLTLFTRKCRAACILCMFTRSKNNYTQYLLYVCMCARVFRVAVDRRRIIYTWGDIKTIFVIARIVSNSERTRVCNIHWSYRIRNNNNETKKYLSKSVHSSSTSPPPAVR